MISISSIGSGSDAGNYFLGMERDSERAPGPERAEDYYQRGADGAGQWWGKGAEALGLGGQSVDREAFTNILQGKDKNGEDLVQGAGEKHRAGWDFTFSAPKAPSVLWGAGDERTREIIQKAHDKAVDAALGMIQSMENARRGKGGTDREAAGLVVAKFNHGTSRALDPDLHTHAVISNLGQRADSSWGGLEPREVFEHKMALGAVYRAEMARELRGKGFNIEKDRDYFSISGVPQSLVEEMSQRRNTIKENMERLGLSSARAAEQVALRTRDAKDPSITPGQLHSAWKNQAANHGFDPEQTRFAKPDPDRSLVGQPMPTPEQILREATDKKSVITRAEILRVTATHAQWRGEGLDTIRQHVERVMSSPELLQVQRKGDERGRRETYTTKELFTSERQTMAHLFDRAHEQNRGVSDAKIERAAAAFAREKGFSLSNEQRAAMEHITRTGGSVRVIVGDAGTGKSTTLTAARMAWQSDGRQVTGIAKSGKAAASLEQSSGIQGQTIDRWLMRARGFEDRKGQWHEPTITLNEKSVIVVDEAGTVGSRQMQEIEKITREAKATLVLVGDHKQAQAVEAGGVFSPLVTGPGAIEAARLTEIYRQKEVWGKELSQTLARGDVTKALSDLHDQGRIHVAKDREAMLQGTVEQWRRDTQTAGTENVLMLAATRATVAELNRRAHQEMKESGKLGASVQARTTDLQGEFAGNLEFAAGDRIQCAKNPSQAQSRDGMGTAKNGDLATITSVTELKGGAIITARMDRTNEIISIDTRRYDSVRYGYASTIDGAQGSSASHTPLAADTGVGSLNKLYSGATRFEHEITVIAAKDAIQKDIEIAGAGVPPTEAMLSFAEDLAAKRGTELPQEARESFAECRNFLNENADKTITENGVEKPDLPQELEDISQLIEVLGKDGTKETTLDYQVVEQQPTPEQPEQPEALPQSQEQQDIEQPTPETAEPQPDELAEAAIDAADDRAVEAAEAVAGNKELEKVPDTEQQQQDVGQPAPQAHEQQQPEALAEAAIDAADDRAAEAIEAVAGDTKLEQENANLEQQDQAIGQDVERPEQQPEVEQRTAEQPELEQVEQQQPDQAVEQPTTEPQQPEQAAAVEQQPEQSAEQTTERQVPEQSLDQAAGEPPMPKPEAQWLGQDNAPEKWIPDQEPPQQEQVEQQQEHEQQQQHDRFGEMEM